MTKISTSKIVLCTGANQGLGYAIIDVAGLRQPSSVYILACRNVDSGHEAVKKLRDSGVKAEIEVIQLDVTNDDHILAAVEFVETKYGKLDVLINNAGIITLPSTPSLSSLREVYTSLISTNLTSVAIVTTAFLPLLHTSPHPKVINVTSGLGSIANTLTQKMGRSPPYGASKIGMNGATMHMQTGENDRVAAAAGEHKGDGEDEKGVIRFYVVNPGVMKTAFSSYGSWGKEPQEGAEVVMKLLEDEKGTFPGGTHWEFVEGEMREVPW